MARIGNYVWLERVQRRALLGLFTARRAPRLVMLVLERDACEEDHVAGGLLGDWLVLMSFRVDSILSA